MSRIEDDIKEYVDKISNAFASDGWKLDYSIESFKEIDRFFDLHTRQGEPLPGGILSEDLGAKLFAIGSYVGETFIKNIPGTSWRTDDTDPEGELSAEIVLPNGTVTWPMQKVLKRLQNGEEDSIYSYGYITMNEYSTKEWWK